MRRLSLSATVVAFLACFAPGIETTASADDAVAVDIGTFVDPLYVAVAPGYPDLLFVVQRGGKIRIRGSKLCVETDGLSKGLHRLLKLAETEQSAP